MKQKEEIIVYAISDNGNGRVMEIGRYNSPDEIQDIVISMFDRNTVISFETKDGQN
jgi:hypothetical protein